MFTWQSTIMAPSMIHQLRIHRQGRQGRQGKANAKYRRVKRLRKYLGRDHPALLTVAFAFLPFSYLRVLGGYRFAVRIWRRAISFASQSMPC
jgi:hypothetical protein